MAFVAANMEANVTDDDNDAAQTTPPDGHARVPATAPEKGTTGQALIDAMQAAASPDLDFDLDPIRTTVPVRDIKF